MTLATRSTDRNLCSTASGSVPLSPEVAPGILVSSNPQPVAIDCGQNHNQRHTFAEGHGVKAVAHAKSHSIDRFGRKVYGPYLAKSTAKRPGKGKLRRHVILLYPDGSRKNTSYARWLMEEHLGRSLTAAETVDHDDENTLNDSITNFKILSHADNCRKHAAVMAAGESIQERHGQ